jgi:hypothetical protein
MKLPVVVVAKVFLSLTRQPRLIALTSRLYAIEVDDPGRR